MIFKNSTTKKVRLDKVAKLYLAYKFFSNLYFAYPIFYQFAQQTIDPLQIGIFFSVIGIVGFMAEIPTGIIADMRGRKSSALIGTITLAIAPLIIFFSHDLSLYLVAAACYGLGRSLLSGALESLVYDHKNVSKTAFRKVNGLEITFSQAGILISAALGGILFSADHSLPFVFETVAGIACIVIISLMNEKNKDNHIIPTASHRQHFVESVRHLFATTHLRVLACMGVGFSVMLGMCIQFVNEAAMIEHSIHPDQRGLLIAGAGSLTILLLHFVIFVFIKSDIARIIYLIFGAVTAYFLMSLGHLPLFLIGYIIWSCLNATSSFIRVMVHDRIPSSHRSTIMSNFKALAVLIGISASTATGILVQTTGTPRSAYIVFTLVCVAILVPCAAWLIADNRSAIT